MARKETQPTTELGRQLEKERISRELTKEAWCAELRISKPAYLGWLTKQTEIQFINVRRIAVVMGVTIDTVFGWMEVDVPIIHVPVNPAEWVWRPMVEALPHGSLAAA